MEGSSGRRGRAHRALALLAAALAGCASPPPPPPGLAALAAEARADPAKSVELIRREGEGLAGKPFAGGNSATLLIDGPASFAALADAIGAARVRIDMESYEFDAQAGGEFADRLLAARARGVEVNLVYDSYGALDTPGALFDRLRAGGVRVLEFNPLVPNGRVLSDPNRRDHRKLLCVDGSVAITGGVNITRVYENPPGGPTDDPDNAAWRDTDVRIEGPAVAQFEAYFMQTWAQQNGPPIAPPPASPGWVRGPFPVQAIDGAPADAEPLIYRTLLAAIAVAQRSVHLTTGYFAPTPDMARALMDAARRGADVAIVVPENSDNDSVVAAGRADYGDLLEAGVRIHERQHRILHAKTAVIDGAWSAVGSSNLDWRSVVWNNEIDAIILGAEFGARMETAFKDDLAASREIDLAAWRARPFLERLKEFRSKLVEELL